MPVTRVELLLRVREDMQARKSGPYVYVGIPEALGFSPGQDGLFGDWLRDVKKAWPGEGWAAAYLRKSGGDHALALRKYVDFAAEFRNLSPEQLGAIPWGAEERKLLGQAPSLQLVSSPVLSLDELLEMRRTGRIGLYIGSARVERLAGYIDGYRLGLSLTGLEDEEYSRFERWLRDSGRVPGGDTWEAALLQAAHGEHEAAIHRFLDGAAEFRGAATRGP